MTAPADSPTLLPLRALLYQALAEPIGLLLRSPTPARAMDQLKRAKEGEEALRAVAIRASPLDDGDIILIHQAALPAKPSAITSPEELGL